jgi:hypothetical protein
VVLTRSRELLINLIFQHSLDNEDTILGQEQGLVNILHGGLEDGPFGALVPRFNGFLSALGCGLMIYIILKSRVKLSSTYHRIMFGISTNGLITSIAFGCSYWLFPSADELLSWPYLISENINRLGNTLTCEIQGAIVISGTYIFQAYVASLCLYYLCAMVLRMRPETITKYVEWFLHLSPLLIGLTTAIMGLTTNSFNPGDTTPWCAFRRYPVMCPTHCWAPDDEGCDCIRGGPEYDRVYFKYVFSISLYVYSTIIFTCLLAICMNTLVSNIKLRIHIYKTKGSSEGESEHEIEDILRFRDTNHKSTLLQTFLYIFTMLVVFFSLLLTKNLPVDGKGYEIVKGLRIFTITVQGLVFFVIFLMMKVHNIRVSDSEVPLCEAAKRVFKEPPDDIVLVNLEMLAEDKIKRRSVLQILEDRDGSHDVGLWSMDTPNGAVHHSSQHAESISKNDISSYVKSNNESFLASNDLNEFNESLASNDLEGFSLASSFQMTYIGEEEEHHSHMEIKRKDWKQ